MQLIWQMLNEEGQRLVNGRIVDQMIVIEDEHERRTLRYGSQVIEQRSQYGRERWRLRCVQHSQRELAEGSYAATQRGDSRDPEMSQLVVQRIQREPGHLWGLRLEA